MKILYATQGTGNGHLSRTRSLAPELIKQGAQVDGVFSGANGKIFLICNYLAIIDYLMAYVVF